MKYLVVLALVASCFASIDKSEMLEKNRIPSDVMPPLKGTCEECETLVKRFVEMADDPKKVAELKTLLSFLCHETSYVDECRVFVAKLDVIIKKLKPYLADSHAVCKSFHMCSNSKLDAFHRIGMLYLKKELNRIDGQNDFACDECQFAAKELRSVVDDKAKQAEFKQFFSDNVCKHLAGYQGMCDMLLEQFLPEMIQQLDAILKDPKAACAEIGFCPKTTQSKKLEKHFAKNLVHPVAQFAEQIGTFETKRGAVLMTCLECKIGAGDLLNTLAANTQNISDALRNVVCNDVLPVNFTASCNDFLGMYLPTVLSMTWQQFTPQGLCNRFHFCNSISLNRLSQIPDSEERAAACGVCKNIQNVLKTSLQTTEVHDWNTKLALDNICYPVPFRFQSTCTNFVSAVVPRLLNKVAGFANEDLLCTHKC